MLGQRQSHAADHVQSAGGRRHRGPALRRGVEGDGGAGQVEGPASDGQLYGGQRARRTTAHGRRQRHVRRHRSVCHAQSGVGTPPPHPDLGGPDPTTSEVCWVQPISEPDQVLSR